MSARLTKWEKAGLHRDAISSRTAVAGNRIVEGAHRGTRSAHRANRQGSVSRSCSAQISERSRNTDWVDLSGKRSGVELDSHCRTQPPRSGDCAKCPAQLLPKEGAKVDYQVAAPTVLGTPTMHRAKIAQPECGWKDGDRAAGLERKESTGRKEKHS